MTIKFGGIDVSNPPPGSDLAGLMERYWHRRRLEPFDHPGYLTHGIDHLPIPYPPKREPPRVGVLNWPVGASRWSTFAQLVTGEQLSAVRSAVGSSTLGDLVISDGTTTVTAGMYLLPPRPVAQKGQNELYLLELVCERYWWWTHGDQKAPDAPASWSALLSALFTSLSLSPTIPSIPAAYGTPDASRWGVGYKPIPLLIDAVCATVGLRVVRDLDGTVRVVTAGTANSDDQANWDANRYECLTGGRYEVADIGKTVPASVAVVFPGDTPSATTVTLASLALSDYAGGTGLSNTVAQVNADLPATASGTARTNYATQAATDYYLWALSLTDATFRGILSWTPTGQEDRVEWDHSSPDLLTRVLRDVLADRNVYGGLPSAAATPSPTCDDGCGWPAHLLKTDCVKLTVASDPDGVVDDQTLFLAWDEAEGKWDTTINGEPDFVYPTGSGPVTFSLGAGQIHLSVDDKELLLDCCGDGFAVFAAGPATGHVGQTGGRCAAAIFKLRVECSFCPGYYCVTYGEDPAQSCVFLDAPPSSYDPEPTVVSGPTVSEAECLLACVTPDPPPTVPTDCGEISGTLTLDWGALIDPDPFVSWGTATLNYFAESGTWIGTGTFANPGCNPVDVTFEYACQNLATPPSPPDWQFVLRAFCDNGGGMEYTPFPLSPTPAGDWNFCGAPCNAGAASLVEV